MTKRQVTGNAFQSFHVQMFDNAHDDDDDDCEHIKIQLTLTITIQNELSGMRRINISKA